MKTLTTLAIVLSTALTTTAQLPIIEEPEGYHLINNFSGPMPGNSILRASVDTNQTKVGSAASRIDYQFSTNGPANTTVQFAPGRYRAKTGGTLKLWIKGDNSGNRLTFNFYHSAFNSQTDQLSGHQAIPSPPAVTLDFNNWREVEFPLKSQAGNRILWWHSLRIDRVSSENYAGKVWLDDMRVIPPTGRPLALAQLDLVGEHQRDWSTVLAFNLDVRNFSDEPFSIERNISVVDRHGNEVLKTRPLTLKFQAGEMKEQLIEFRPDNLANKEPPFSVTTELTSVERPELATTRTHPLVIANSVFLLDDFSDVHGTWFASGWPFNLTDRGQQTSIFGEPQRAHPGPQLAARIGRVSLASGENQPSTPYAMRIDYNADTMIHRRLRRELPGAPFAVGAWVKGDGQGGELWAVIIDFSAPGSNFYNWKRTLGKVKLCDLNFKGWKYFEKPVIGAGLGKKTIRGSTDGIDYPLEFVSLAVVAPRLPVAQAGTEVSIPLPATGQLHIGGLKVKTQQSKSEALAVFAGYDDPLHVFDPKHGITITVQNSWAPAARELVRLKWRLTDRDDELIATATEDFSLDPLGLKTFRPDLASHVGKAASHDGPLRLRVNVEDRKGKGNAETTLILAKPDSAVTLTGFESARPKFGFPPDDVYRAMGFEKGQQVIGALKTATAEAVTTQKHAGARALAMKWTKGQPAMVALDPLLPGIPTEVSLWVYGDKSNVILYPLLGDQNGAISDKFPFDLFLPFAPEGGLQNVVRVDWAGWKQVRFRLPVIPSTWNDTKANHGFIPTYPLGLHLAVAADQMATDETLAVNRANSFVAAARKALAAANTRKTSTDKTMATVKAALMKQTMALMAAEKAAAEAATAATTAKAATTKATTGLDAAEKDVLAKTQALQKYLQTEAPMKRKPAMDKVAAVAKTLLDASRAHADTGRVLVALDAAIAQATQLHTTTTATTKASETAASQAAADAKTAATTSMTAAQNAATKKTTADTARTALETLVATKQKPAMVAVKDAKAKLTAATRTKTTADTAHNRARTALANAQIDARTAETIAAAAEAKAKAVEGDPRKTPAQKTAAMNLATAKRKLATAAASRLTAATSAESTAKGTATTATTTFTTAQTALATAENTLKGINTMAAKATTDAAAADKLHKEATATANTAKGAADRAAALQARLDAAVLARRALEATAKKNVDQLTTVSRKAAMDKDTAAKTAQTTSTTAKATADKALEAINKDIATATAAAITARTTAEGVVKKAKMDLEKAQVDQAKAEQLGADRKQAAVDAKASLEAFKNDETSGGAVLTAAAKAVTEATTAQTAAQAQLKAAQDQKAKKEEGVLYIDDVQVVTHLPLAERIRMSVEREGDSNVLQPGNPMRVRVVNAARTGTVAVTVSGGLYNWRGERVSGEDKPLSLAPGLEQTVDFAAKVLPGAYRLQVDMKSGEKILRTLSEEFLVLDATTVLGEQWKTDIGSTDKLRHPIGGAFTLIRHDWDWMEFQPGNLQVHTLLNFAYQVRAQGHSPQVILGYSPYWASGSGYDAMVKNELSPRGGYDRGGRDWGHAVDIFHAPRRMDDWDNYMREVMRKAGRHVEGFIVWDSPDSPPTKMGLGIKPENFSKMLKLSDQWRKRFCPQTPIIIGGLSRKTAIGYLTELEKHDCLKYIDGVNLRLDAGRSTPEDARIRDYLEDVRGLLNKSTDANASAPMKPKSILVTDLDWAVEKSADDALDGFDQAAFLARARLLLHSMGVEHALTIANKDAKQIGFGLAYRKPRSIPPLEVSPAAHRLKPGWLAMARTGNLLGQLRFEKEVTVPDRSPGRTWCFKYTSEADGAPVVIMWRNHQAGAVNFSGTGLTVTKAEDLFGTPATAEDGWWPIGKMPVAFTLKQGTHESLGRLWVKDPGAEPHWTQRALATFTPATGASYRHEILGGESKIFTGRDFSGRLQSLNGIFTDNNGTERFALPAQSNAGILIRKKFYLGKTGQKASVWVNGKSIGSWDFQRKVDDSKLSEGIREAAFIIPPSALTNTNIANIELRYSGPANTLGWTALEYDGAPAPLQSLGALHVDSPVVPPRRARNVVGQPLRVGETEYTEGISAFAPALLDYPLNGQYEKFTAQVGVDAATEGKGSVAFEVYADGKQVWTSGQMTGLDKPKDVDVPVKGVKRLRLVVTDGGDGNKFDVADWANARLHTSATTWQGVKLSAVPPTTVIAEAKTTEPSAVVSAPNKPVTTLKPRHTGTRMLASKDLVVEVMDPAAANRYYTGVRFTPLAAVLRAVKGGKEYFFNPVTHNAASDHAGLASEFDLITPGGPPGFAEAAANGGFLKVGVGVLTKSTDQYQFWNNYPAKTLAKTAAQWGTNTVTFSQALPPTGGYGYLLTAKVTLEGPALHVDWTLKNTGFKPLKTRQYTHNFFRFSEKNVGPGYVISFPYTPQPGGLNDGQRHAGREIHFTKAVANPINANVPWPSGFTGANAVTVRHTATGQAIECITSIPGINTALHATAQHVCPEQFVEIALPPGKARQWRRSYIFK